MQKEVNMSERKQPFSFEKLEAIFLHYVNYRKLTEEEFSQLSDLIYIPFAVLDLDLKDTEIPARMVQAIFNLGYECGQKSKE